METALRDMYRQYLKECDKFGGLACNMPPLCFEGFKMAKTYKGKLLKQ